MPESVVVTGIGMRTPVGNDAIQTASAVRAGINRFAFWEAMGTAFEENAGVVASALPDDLGDQPWVAKVIDMVPEPIHEALWHSCLFDFNDVRAQYPRAHVAAYIATPYEDRAGVAQEAFRLFSMEAREHCVAPAHADSVQLFSCDHAAGIMAIERAARDLLEHKVAFAVVVAVDSLLHAEHLRSLWGEDRLKLPNRSDGLVPGEAVAVVVLERARDAKARGTPILARLGETATDRESVPLGPEHPIRAEAASRAINAALAGSGGQASVDRVIVDLSGERWRSLEWALVETRCLGELAHGWQLWHPADCLGDVGAATSVVHLAIASRAFARGYGGGGVLLSAASPRGERAAMTIFPGKEPA